ncbi:MAG TPA: thiamine pyrophosphate-binding protein [Gaiellaceae bacterium]|nr:thiamine pyrophosphate-binding protein [Gaiellaceae bacterium]
MELITAGQAIVETWRAEGVRYVFGLPGGHVLSVVDALYGRDEIAHVLVRHEHAAACMAAAYAQLTGEPGVCLVTAGPGATNLATGIAEAYVGSLPVVVVAGRGATANAYRGAAQEVATERLFAPITKWAVRVDRADLVWEVMHEAFARARNGKPGPVYVDVPRDLLDAEIPRRRYVPAGPPVRPPADAARVEDAATTLARALRPLIVAGGGAVASGAWVKIRELAELLAIPVVTSLAGRGSIADDHPLSVGGLGVHRNRLSKRLLAEADVVLGLGCRFEEMETNWQPGFLPDPDALYLQVDIDPTEIGRSIPVYLGLVGDVRTVLEQLLAVLHARRVEVPGGFLEQQRTWEAVAELTEIDAEADALAAGDERPIQPLRVIRAIRSVFPRETTVAIDVGAITQHIAGGTPFFRVFEPRSLIVPSSFYGMGFASAGLPAARLAHPTRPAVGLVGDGSFQMVTSVLPVAVEHELPVTWCVFDDQAYGSIWDVQQHRFGKRFLGTSFSVQPDFAAIAAACGCHGERVEDPADVEDALRRALDANKRGIPAVIDFAVARERLPQTLEFAGFDRP